MPLLRTTTRSTLRDAARTCRLIATFTAATLTASLLVPGPAHARQHAASPTRASSPDVVVIGDSLTLGALTRGDLAARLKRVRSNPVIKGINGLTTEHTPAALRELLRGTSPTAVVLVAVGTNDATWALDSDLFARRVRAVLAVTNRRHVVWVDIHTTTARAHTRRLNRVLSRLAARHDRMTVAAWSAHPAADLLAADGIHLTRRGYAKRAAFIADAVSAALEERSSRG